jgi:hypothetical protein
MQIVPEPMKKKKAKKEKKRPRDKILRDMQTGKLALDMRRRGAFLGYAYRKPKGLEALLDRVSAEGSIESPSLGAGAGLSATVSVSQMASGRRDSAVAGLGKSPSPEREREGDYARLGVC